MGAIYVKPQVLYKMNAYFCREKRVIVLPRSQQSEHLLVRIDERQ